MGYTNKESDAYTYAKFWTGYTRNHLYTYVYICTRYMTQKNDASTYACNLTGDMYVCACVCMYIYTYTQDIQQKNATYTCA